jgi:hypothetical protein
MLQRARGWLKGRADKVALGAVVLAGVAVIALASGGDSPQGPTFDPGSPGDSAESDGPRRQNARRAREGPPASSARSRSDSAAGEPRRRARKRGGRTGRTIVAERKINVPSKTVVRRDAKPGPRGKRGLRGPRGRRGAGGESAPAGGGTPPPESSPSPAPEQCLPGQPQPVPVPPGTVNPCPPNGPSTSLPAPLPVP